jgi:outer membrane protein assembly factor BamB
MHMLRILVFACLLFNVSLASAEEDPWYETAPGCMIDKGNPQRTNVYRNVPLIDLNKSSVKRWEIKVKNYSSNILCYKDSIITVDGAFDLNTGKKIWEAHIPIEELNVPDGAGQIYKNKQFTVGSDANKGSLLYQVDPSTGQILHVDILNNPEGYQAKTLLMYNDIAYLYDFKGVVEAYDINKHKLVWLYSAREGKRENMSSVLATDGSYLAFTNSSSLIVLDIHTGKLVFTVQKVFDQKPAFINKSVCVFQRFSIQCFDEASGHKEFDFHNDQISPSQAVLLPKNIFFANAYMPNDLYAISITNDLSPKLSQSFGHVNTRFAINNILYFYDYDRKKLCAYDNDNKKMVCQEYDLNDAAFRLPTEKGLIGGSTNNILFFYAST